MAQVDFHLSTQPWCLFQVRTRPHAVALERVVEIVTVDTLVRFPLAPRPMLGLFVLRRDVVPVVDIGPVSQGDLGYTEGKAVVLVLKAEQGMWGVRIDREGTLLVEAAPEEGAPGRPARVVHGEKPYVLIDPEAIWRETRTAVVGQYRPAAAAIEPTGADSPRRRVEARGRAGSIHSEAFSPEVFS